MSSSSLAGRLSVLFEDVSGIWAPLPSLYWSSSSDALVSKHPLSCILDIDTVYCPQCLSRFDDLDSVGGATRAATSIKNSLEQGRCNKCKICNFCNSPCTVTASPDKSSSVIKCNYCLWSATLDLSSQRPHYKDKHLDEIIKFWSESLSSNSQPIEFTPVFPSSINTSNNADVKGAQLRSKFIVRCRKDVEEFSENILAQRRPLPLDGDSSSALNKGKWFLKQQLAIKVVPAIYVVSTNSDIIESSNMADNYMIVRIVNPHSAKLSMKITIEDVKYSGDREESIALYDEISKDVSAMSCHSVVVEEGSRPIGFTFDLAIGAYEDDLLRSESSQVAFKSFNYGKPLSMQQQSIAEITSHSTAPAPQPSPSPFQITEYWSYRDMVEFSVYFPLRSADGRTAAVNLSMAISHGQARYSVKSKICLSPNA